MGLALATFFGGLVVLTGGAYALVRGAAALALRLGLTPLVVGLTVVAFGTSAPELVVSVQAALRGAGGIAVGNVVGSNIANVGLILGLAALIRPITPDAGLMRRDAVLMVGTSAVLVGLLWDGRLGVAEAVPLVLALVAYLAYSIRAARKDHRLAAEAGADLPAPSTHALVDVGLIGIGLGGLVVGASWMVNGAVVVAEAMGVSEAVIGLTVVAVGTSLPELATSVVAALRGESDIAAGNVVGSNLFNLLGILGVTALVRPLHAPGLGVLDLGTMLALAVVGMLFLATGRRLSRPEGGLLVALYGVYIAVLVTTGG